METLENTFTYEGRPLTELKGGLEYVNERLSSSNLELWERKEYEAVRKDLKFQINDVQKRIELFSKDF